MLHVPMPPGAEEDRIDVLYLVGTLEVGGAETQLVELATHLGQPFRATVCCLGPRGPLAVPLEGAGVRVVCLGIRGVRTGRGLAKIAAAGRLPAQLLEARRLVRTLKPAIVHGVLFHAYVLAALLARAGGQAKVVASRRSLAHFKRDRPVFRFFERLANRRTDLIIANSAAVAEDTVRSEGLSRDRIQVIHNGLDVTRYSGPTQAKARRQLHVPDEAPVVLVVANLIAYKGHRYFLQAWTDVCAEVPGAIALLAGDGPARASLEEQARALGLGDRVRFLGVRRDVPELLAAADLLVHPSLEEGFCNAVIEAMAAGRPVVATAVGGTPEAVTEGTTGWLVPARDPRALSAAILRIFKTADRGRGMGEAGRRIAQNRFERSRMVAAYELAYRKLLATKAD